MNDSLIPHWIKQRAAQSALKTAQQEARVQKEHVSRLTVEKHSAEFWLELRRALEINAQALREGHLAADLHCFIDPISEPTVGEQVLRVQVGTRTPSLHIVRRDIRFCLPNGNAIYCCKSNTVKDDVWEFVLAVLQTGDGIGAVPLENFTPMSAQQTADYIVRRMVDMLD